MNSGSGRILPQRSGGRNLLPDLGGGVVFSLFSPPFSPLPNSSAALALIGPCALLLLKTLKCGELISFSNFRSYFHLCLLFSGLFTRFPN